LRKRVRLEGDELKRRLEEDRSQERETFQRYGHSE
jgi:hypothetical protein